MGPATKASSSVVRFGVFEFDINSGELYKQGRRVRVSGQPTQILEFLLRRPGELITREELKRLLWPADTHVSFAQSLNAAVKRLRHALGDSPETPRFIETVARRGYRFIAPASAPDQPVPSPRAAPRIRSLAVLPFENSTADSEVEYLTDGVTEAVINSLSRLPAFRVLARSTVFRYRGKRVDCRAVGRKLSVDAVLLGRVFKRGDELVIGTELVDVHNGWLIWGEQFSCRMSAVHLIEADVSGRISEMLRSEWTGKTDAAAGARRHALNTDAYQDYLKGRYHWNRMSAEGLLKSAFYFEEALKKDSGFALAHAGLADSYGLQGFFGLLPPSDAMPKCRNSAQRALEIDANLAEAHNSLANVLKMYDRDWPASERSYRQALQLNPNYVHAYRGYAALLAATGRFAESMIQIGRAHELDPMSVVVRMEMAWNFYIAREYQQAIQHALRTAELEPEFPSAQYILALACEQQGRFAEAQSAFERSLDRSGGHASGLAGLGHLFGATGRRKEAAGMLDRLNALAAQSYVAPFWQSAVCAGLGAIDQAIAHLEVSYAQNDMWLVWLNTDPRFDKLRDDVRFRDLLRRVGFVGQAAGA
jgi:TolB-like protein/tetratricopeptide (TPR) repeat protein